MATWYLIVITAWSAPYHMEFTDEAQCKAVAAIVKQDFTDMYKYSPRVECVKDRS